MSSQSQSQHSALHYAVEHLATFSTNSLQQQQTTPRMALQRLFAMEKTSGIWTQRMAIQLKGNNMWILDGESNDVVERFPVTLIQQPTAFNDYNHIYNNILIFTVQPPNESQGELHIFQCVSHNAIHLVEDIQQWMRHYGVDYNIATLSDPSISPTTNVNVKETVNVFNQIAAQRENRKDSSSPVGVAPQGRIAAHYDPDSRSITTKSSIDSNHHNGAHRTNSHDQTLSNERYVSILNHCFDDIERFIIRLQHAAAALRELQLRNHKRQGKGQTGDGLLAMRARGPNEEDFFEIMSKFKLAFNLLAKLKGCIHDPNAPELVHFLFTPLAIIIEAARSNDPPIDPSVVGLPFLNNEAIDLLSNCCTSKEFDLWQSLGPNWIHTIKHNPRLSSSYQPVFTDGWAPNITEPELIGVSSESETEEDHVPIHPIHVHHEDIRNRRDVNSKAYPKGAQYDDSDIDDNHIENRHIQQRMSPSTSSHLTQATRVVRGNSPPSPIDSIERDSPTAMPVNEMDQSEWISDLQARNAKIVRVLFPRTANNDKELTVIRGEILEVLDDSRKWWKARNWRGQVAHVPHTIVTEINHTNGRGERDSNVGNTSPNDDWIRRERQEAQVDSRSALFAELRNFKRNTDHKQVDPLYSVPNKQNPNALQQTSPKSNAQNKKPLIEDSNRIDVIVVNNHEKVNKKPSLEAKISNASKESARRLSKEYLPKPTENGNQDSDRLSLVSHQSSFHDELTATLRSRKSVIKPTNGISDKSANKQNNDNQDELTFTLLIEHLHRKNFHPRLISVLTDEKTNHKDIINFLLSATKQKLRDILPADVADEYELQRLHSNFVILKNMYSYAPVNDELNSKLNKRRTLYDPINNST